MPVTVRIPSYLAAFAEGRSSIVVEGAPLTADGVLQSLWSLHPALRDRILDEQGQKMLGAKESKKQLVARLEEQQGMTEDAIEETAQERKARVEAEKAQKEAEEKAADEAVSKLAFEQATRLLRLMLDTNAAASVDHPRLRVRLGEVLEWSGRSEEAAEPRPTMTYSLP